MYFNLSTPRISHWYKIFYKIREKKYSGNYSIYNDDNSGKLGFRYHKGLLCKDNMVKSEILKTAKTLKPHLWYFASQWLLNALWFQASHQLYFLQTVPENLDYSIWDLRTIPAFINVQWHDCSYLIQKTSRDWLLNNRSFNIWWIPIYSHWWSYTVLLSICSVMGQNEWKTSEWKTFASSS